MRFAPQLRLGLAVVKTQLVYATAHAPTSPCAWLCRSPHLVVVRSGDVVLYSTALPTRKALSEAGRVLAGI